MLKRKPQLIIFFSILFLFGCISYPDTPEGVVKQYVEFVSSGNCEEALEFCTGTALQSTNGIIDSGCESYKVSVDSIDCQISDTTSMCLSYQTFESMDGPMQLPYKLLLVNGEWKIADMSKDLLGWWCEEDEHEMILE